MGARYQRYCRNHAGIDVLEAIRCQVSNSRPGFARWCNQESPDYHQGTATLRSDRF